jgi:hypothetical protein
MWTTNWPPGGGHRDLAAEFVGLVRLALADALPLGGVEGIDLRQGIASALGGDALGQPPAGSDKSGRDGLRVRSAPGRPARRKEDIR